MNQILFPRTSYDGTSLSKTMLEKWYCENIESEIYGRLEKIETTTHLGFMEKRALKWIKCCLHHLLLASPQWMERVSRIVDRYGEILFRSNGANAHCFKDEIYAAFNYDGYRKNTLILLAEKLNIKSCPYCNMHYTLFAEEGRNLKDKITKFQFDHFFNKADYPFLSMSLYNLIPSCAVCNQGKSAGKLSLKFHPYASSINNQFHFVIPNPLALYFGAKKDKIEVELKPDACSEDELVKYEDMFHIKMLYRRHGDIVQEVFDKAYEEPYYFEPKFFKFLKGDASAYLFRLVYGVYSSDLEIEKRPMSKFIHDIRGHALFMKMSESQMDKLRIAGDANN